MTPMRALAKANLLWGKGKEYLSAGGHINKRRRYEKMEASLSPEIEWRFDVGYIVDLAGIAMFSVQGTGNSWEDAFRVAEEKRLKDKAEMDAIRQKHGQPVTP
jgi:hypothetical protein